MKAPALEMKQLNDWLDKIETEIHSFRALSGLMAGHNGAPTVDIAELSFLIDPSLERMAAVIGEIKAWKMGGANANG